MKDFNDFLNEMALFQIDKEIKDFDMNKSKLSYDAAVKKVEDILNKYADSIKSTSDKFYQLLKKYSNRGKANILFNVKPMKSVLSKVYSRGKSLASISDLIRGALLFDTQEELDEFVKDFRRKESNIIVHYEAKEKGSDPTYGYYGSHHFSIMIDGIMIELQTMTKKLWQFKHTAHAIYTNTRDAGVVTKADMELSKKIFNLGNKPKYVKECIEEGQTWVLIE